MKRMIYFLAAFVCLPLCLLAQDDSKYLAGAVPVVNGKVVFTKTISVPGLSQDEIFKRIQQWTGERFVTDKEQKGRILYSDQTKGDIACWGEEYLTFNKAALSLDRTLITYQMIITCEPGECNLKITAIRYSYNVANKNEPEKYMAEELITDEYTLNKNKDKLIRKTGKFRTHTIDMVDQLFTDAAAVLTAGQPSTAPATTPPAITTPKPETPASQLTAHIPTAAATS